MTGLGGELTVAPSAQLLRSAQARDAGSDDDDGGPLDVRRGGEAQREAARDAKIDEADPLEVAVHKW